MTTPDKTVAQFCQIITDWTCDEDGDADEDIPCGQRADWIDETGLLVCSECHSQYDLSDRLRFRWLDDTREAS